MSLKQLIQTLPDGEAYRHALFYKLPGGLRFRMSEDNNGFTDVLTALRKASTVCDDVFAGTDTVLVHLQRFATPNRFDMRSTLAQLKMAGIAIPRERALWAEPAPRDYPGDDDNNWWVNAVFEVPKLYVPNLLWCAFVTDMWHVRPNPHCLVYLINRASGLIVNPYDDRGMDVVGNNHEALRQLYTKHRDWLLAYDLEVMDSTFGSPPAA